MSHIPIDSTCPLCQTSAGKLFYSNRRDYYRCSICYLVYVLPHEFLSAKEEEAVYDHHTNSPDDLRYRCFLNRLFLPMLHRLDSISCGLDFGSGPGPTLSVMFEEAGHCMKIYDPFYAKDINLLQEQYDFITASEVVEHLHHPRRELDRLWSCLKPNGLLGIMTKRVISQEAFSNWHYIQDPTHVCFFSIETFRWLANYWSAAFSIIEDDVVLFSKTNTLSIEVL